MSKKIKTDRIIRIDIFKAFAILAIVFWHAGFIPTWTFVWAIPTFVFSTASLYGANMSKLSLEKTVYSMLWILLQIFVITSIFYFVGASQIGEWKYISISPTFWIMRNPYLGNLWYFALHYQILALLLLIKFVKIDLAKLKKWYFGLLMLVFSLSVSYFLLKIVGKGLTFNVFSWMFVIWIGLLYYEELEKFIVCLHNKNKALFFASMAISLLLIILVVYVGGSGYSDMLSKRTHDFIFPTFIIQLLYIYILFCVSEILLKYRKICKYIARFGEYTMYIYLLHILFAVIIFRYLGSIGYIVALPLSLVSGILLNKLYQVLKSFIKRIMDMITKSTVKLLPITTIIIFVIIVVGAYILYVNILPFGISKQITLYVGAANDTMTELKILPSSDWGDREVDENNLTYRTLRGSAILSYTPSFVLTDANVTFDIMGDNVGFYPPSIDFDKDLSEWKKNWDFSNSISTEFEGSPYVFDNCAYFDGKSILSLKNSKSDYETGPFTVYVEWLPESDLDFQEIVGHFNWEIFQSKNFVIFQIGKTTDTEYPFYTIKAPIDAQFFNKKHSVLAQYNPDAQDGYIEMFLDNVFVERRYIKNAVINPDYGDKDLSMGWSAHNFQKNPFLKGCIYTVRFSDSVLLSPEKNMQFVSSDPSLTIPVVGNGNVYNVSIKVEKDGRSK